MANPFSGREVGVEARRVEIQKKIDDVNARIELLDTSQFVGEALRRLTPDSYYVLVLVLSVPEPDWLLGRKTLEKDLVGKVVYYADGLALRLRENKEPVDHRHYDGVPAFFNLSNITAVAKDVD